MSRYNDCCEGWKKFPPSLRVDFDDDYVIVEIMSKPEFSIKIEKKYDVNFGIDLWENWMDDEFFSTFDTDDQAEEVAKTEVEGWLIERELDIFGLDKKLPDNIREPILNDLVDYVFTPLIVDEWERRHPPKFSDNVRWGMKGTNF